jgi:uncharacterized protein YbjT (DUF2867 family)
MVTTIFGARGSVGRNVADGLRTAGEQVRVTSRDPDSAGFPPGTKVVAADLENPRSLPAALEGATGVFCTRSPAVSTGSSDEFAEAPRVRSYVPHFSFCC